ncbi:MAG: hypothetical protein OEW33_17135, partial [Nitrospirota bacterium]|nr:hypothetical protein [Nitrospirota bacterium]
YDQILAQQRKQVRNQVVTKKICTLLAYHCPKSPIVTHTGLLAVRTQEGKYRGFSNKKPA